MGELRSKIEETEMGELGEAINKSYKYFGDRVHTDQAANILKQNNMITKEIY